MGWRASCLTSAQRHPDPARVCESRGSWPSLGWDVCPTLCGGSVSMAPASCPAWCLLSRPVPACLAVAGGHSQGWGSVQGLRLWSVRRAGCSRFKHRGLTAGSAASEVVVLTPALLSSQPPRFSTTSTCSTAPSRSSARGRRARPWPCATRECRLVRRARGLGRAVGRGLLLCVHLRPPHSVHACSPVSEPARTVSMQGLPSLRPHLGGACAQVGLHRTAGHRRAVE